MIKRHIPGTWEAKLDGEVWKIFDNGQLIATLSQRPDAKAKAKLISMSPYIMEALKGVVELMGDEDLPDNGEFSGAAVSDMVRSAVGIVAET